MIDLFSNDDLSTPRWSFHFFNINHSINTLPLSSTNPPPKLSFTLRSPVASTVLSPTPSAAPAPPTAPSAPSAAPASPAAGHCCCATARSSAAAGPAVTGHGCPLEGKRVFSPVWNCFVLGAHFVFACFWCYFCCWERFLSRKGALSLFFSNGCHSCWWF